MGRFQFGVCEFSFPCWGPLALQMAHEAGYTGMQLADAGGSTNAYPLNNKRVQDSYLEASAKYGIQLQSIHLYTLVRQNFIRYSQSSPEGQECMESIKNGIIAASEMHIPTVMIEGMRMYGAAQHQHVLDMYKYAVKVAGDYGVQIAMETDVTLENHFKFLDQFDGKLKLCFDTHNPVMYGTGYPPDMIRALGKDRIDHFHMKESQPDAEGFVTKETAPIVLLGQGGTFFKESVQAIKDIGYEGWIISETFYNRRNMNENGMDYVSSAKRDVETLKAAFGED
ncbi:sugar phosphate isomerase/epimerase family protein [Dysosmobacter sp.]|jgi:sugar phosphate isomerase/epimerase|uniref:sugar phosphate isomerase/epimerase family protein n=1 Tax=Dysosmobacter sp. TaxID=2591382 RepID=UPI002A9AA9B0|nr:sugar phosphate isomerase/epimerase family protein [Dysosmobacter sp.]MCI6055685.1 sugar phosphate isomerase/epimerase [Dysosmobacter sp.]MDY5509265.1 sugar phosphate isomerase/epimerase family protein [Dysosmobacter sp.]